MGKFVIALDAPLVPLFEFLADPRNRQNWQSSIVRLDMESEGEPRVGMKWREHARGLGHFQMEITECVSGVTWAERGTSSRGTIDLQLKFDATPDPSRTQITLVLDMNLRGLFALVNPVAPSLIWPLMKADLRRAAQLCLHA